MPRSRSKYSEDAVLKRKNTIRDILLGVLVGLAVIFVIKFLMGYIKKHDFKVFGYYRIALGILVLLFFALK